MASPVVSDGASSTEPAPSFHLGAAVEADAPDRNAAPDEAGSGDDDGTEPSSSSDDSPEPKTPPPAPHRPATSIDAACATARELLGEWELEARRDDRKALRLCEDALCGLQVAIKDDDGVDVFLDPPVGPVWKESSKSVLGSAMAANAYTYSCLEKNPKDEKRALYNRAARWHANMALRWAPWHPHANLVLAELSYADGHDIAAMRHAEDAQRTQEADRDLLPRWRASHARELLVKVERSLRKMGTSDGLMGKTKYAQIGGLEGLREAVTVLSLPFYQVFRGVGKKIYDVFVEQRGVPAPGPDGKALPVTALSLLAQNLDDPKGHEARLKMASSQLYTKLAPCAPWCTPAPGSQGRPDFHAKAGMVDLHISAITWNTRTSLIFHSGLPGCLDVKIANLFLSIKKTSAVVVALQECPGSGVFEKVPLGYLKKLITEQTALPGRWRYSEAAVGTEAAGFAYDSDVLAPLVTADGQLARLFPDTPGVAALKFARPPALALFKAAGGVSAPPGILAVLSVHLKAVDGLGTAKTRAELLRLAADVVPWVEGQLETAQGPSSLMDDFHILLLGDFNLAVSEEGDMKHGARSFAGSDWKPLLALGFKSLLDGKETTNMGPPVTQKNDSYDAVLFRHQRGPRGGARLTVDDNYPASASIYRHRTLVDGLKDAANLLRVIDKRDEIADPSADSPSPPPKTPFVDGILDFKKMLKDHVYGTWSDHWPVVAHFEFDLGAARPPTPATPPRN